MVAQEIRKLADLTRTVSDHVSAVIKDTNQGVEKGVVRIKGLGTGFSEIMKRSEEIRTMIAQNSSALEDVTRAHKEIQDGLAGVDTLIRSILEVSHDLRLMTERLASAFSWFGETLKLREEPGPPGPIRREALRGPAVVPDVDPSPWTASPRSGTGRRRQSHSASTASSSPTQLLPAWRITDVLTRRLEMTMRTSSPGLTCRRNFAFSTVASTKSEDPPLPGSSRERPRLRTAPGPR